MNLNDRKIKISNSEIYIFLSINKNFQPLFAGVYKNICLDDNKTININFLFGKKLLHGQ